MYSLRCILWSLSSSPPQTQTVVVGLSQRYIHHCSRLSVALSNSWSSSSSRGSVAAELKGRRPTHIIVGAGSAGCVLANRLSENPSNHVLLLEAGPRDHRWNWKIHMPAALMYNLCDDKYNWFYMTTPQKNINNRVMYWPRGRVWGGSSSLNAMVYVRGHPMDYDRWEREGAHGWNFVNCLPYFKKAETYNLSKGPNDPYRGCEGPLKVTQGQCEHPLHQAFLASADQHGIGRSADMNGYRQEGLAPMDMTIDKGVRCSASKAYLHPILNRPNLCVSSNILVTRVLFDKKRAVGVEVLRKPNFHSTTSLDRKDCEKVLCEGGDVIIASGAINAPQLLMLSGVGPADHLKNVGIEVVHDLQGVGRNLTDHLEIYVQQKCLQPITLYNKSSWRFPHNMIKIGLQWLTTHTGLGASSHLESGGFARSSDQVAHPDIQFHFLPSTVHDDGRKTGKCHAYQVHVGPMRSKSKGDIRLRSNDPRRHPIMDPQYMSYAEDFVEFRRCIRLSREILGQPAFDAYRGEELAPGSQCQTDEQIDEFVRSNAASAYHPCGTCKMGSSNDQYAVVNPTNMSVYGVENLKVVDASIMPSIVSGNLNAPVIMLAERAADLIEGKVPLKGEKVAIWSADKQN